MNDTSNRKKCESTPERKREYVQRWLEVNLLTSIQYDPATREKTPPDLTNLRSCTNSPSRHQNHTLCGQQASPVLGGKRIASSPVIGGRRRSLKRMKLIRSKLKNENSASTSNSIETTEKSEIQSKPDDYNEIVNSNSNTDCFNSPKSSKDVNRSLEKFTKISTAFEHPISQFIESVSSENRSHDNSEINVQEINSDSDKTESDLIEEISTQMFIEQSCDKKHVLVSQNISNPSSNSSETFNLNNAEKSSTTALNSNLQSVDTFASIDQIDSASTLESRVDFGKTSYILHYADEKQKRKKHPKKGSLLDSLVTAMAKERSNVNLFRHQLNKKSNIVEEKPFVLLLIVEHLPMNNNNQFFKCKVIEDNKNLFSDLLKDKTHNFVTVMNVPEISCLVNVNEKPILKVYEPWTILDPKQLFLHITRFVAVPSSDLKTFNSINDSMQDKELKMLHEHHCPCLDEKIISVKCKTKFTDSSNNIIKIIFNNQYS